MRIIWSQSFFDIMILSCENFFQGFFSYIIYECFKLYIQKYIDVDGKFEIFVNDENISFLLIKI